MSLTYEVRRSLAGQDDWTVVASDLSEPTLRDTGLTVDTAYDYQVRACNEGGCSAWSASVTVTPLDIRYDVRQSLAGQNDWTVIATDLIETEYLVEGLEPNTGYDFQVRACISGVCSDWSDVASATTDAQTGHDLQAAAILELVAEAVIDTTPDSGAADLVAATILELVADASLRQDHLLAGSAILDLVAEARIQTGDATDLEAAAILELVATAELEQPHDLRGAAVLELVATTAIATAHNLHAAAILELVAYDAYLGPGTGLVVAGGRLTTDAVLALAEEGDTFLALLPWGGIDGRAGTLQILSRTVTDQGARPEFQFAFQEFGDPNLVPVQRGGGRARYRPPQRSDPYRDAKRGGRDRRRGVTGPGG